MTYYQIRNDPIQLTSNEHVEFHLCYTELVPKLLGLNLFSISLTCFALGQTLFDDYESWRVAFRLV
jgi:hypothetical protein